MRKIRTLRKKNKIDQNRMLLEINQRVKKVAKDMEHTTIADYIQLLNSPRKLIWTNFVAGLSRGVGLAIGFTIIASTIVYFLQLLITLNLPYVGKFIADIVKLVQDHLGYK
jgi:hypothetical protein